MPRLLTDQSLAWYVSQVFLEQRRLLESRGSVVDPVPLRKAKANLRKVYAKQMSAWHGAHPRASEADLIAHGHEMKVKAMLSVLNSDTPNLAMVFGFDPSHDPAQAFDALWRPMRKLPV